MTAPRWVRPVMFALAVALAAGTTGCPSRTKRHVGSLKLPTNGDPEARRRFDSLQARFGRDGKGDVADGFEQIVEQYPDDPIVPYALLYAGMAAVKAGNYQQAVENLEKLDEEIDASDPVRAHGRLYRGVALNYLGRHEDALVVLRGAQSLAGDTDKDERTEWLAAMAEATSRTGHGAEAIGHYDAWYPLARASERAYIVARVRALVEALDDGAASAAYEALGERKSGPAAALLGERVANQFSAVGDNERAERVRSDTQGAREAIGLGSEPDVGDGGDTGRVGAVLPLSGRRNRVGDLYMRGLSLAASVFDSGGASGAGGGKPRPFALSVRDSGSTDGAAGSAVEELAAEAVIAIVGPEDIGGVDRAADAADRLGVPLVSLSARSGAQKQRSRFVFHVVHSPEDRARALARYAVREGIKDFGVFAPTNRYGKAVAAAFAREVERLGGTIVVEVGYAHDATSFKSDVGKLRKPWQALFVPDQSKRLELIAPALAAANFESRPVDQRKGSGKRKFLLLSTAELLEDRFVSQAGRYAWGAVLAPGFYPDRNDPRIGAFVDEYYSSFGRTPNALDAYGYDAAVAIRAAIEGGARSRRQLADALARGTPAGLTGTIQFSGAHSRADDGVLFKVEKVGGDFAIRAIRATR